jgi:predicted RNA binding protein with dsRBD fold (UPF0201 family)
MLRSDGRKGVKYAYVYAISMVSVTVSCPIYPSEDPQKVRAAVLRIFPDISEEEGVEGKIVGKASLDNFSKIIRKQEILDSTRAMMFKGARDNTTVLHLNKQVATVGKVSFADKHPILGSIDVTVQDDDLEALIDRVAPQTVDGKEVFH